MRGRVARLGRHLDQIIMCSVYGVCKVNRHEVTFRQIIEQYKRQPKATPKAKPKSKSRGKVLKRVKGLKLREGLSLGES